MAFPEQVSVPAHCSPAGPAQAAASMYVTGLTTQQTLLLFTEMLRLVLVVFATVQVHRPLKEELLLTPLLSLLWFSCVAQTFGGRGRLWDIVLEAGVSL